MWDVIKKYEAEAVELILGYGPKIVLATLFLYLGLKIIDAGKRLFHNRLVKKLAYENLPSYLSQIFAWLLRGVLFISVASMLGIETASFITLIAAISLAIGLALQGALTNFASGVLLLLFRPFKVGDYIEIDSQVGFVHSIDIFYTTLITPLNVTVIIPNSNIAKANISNFSALGIVILELKIGIASTDKQKQAQLIIENILSKHSSVLSEPHFRVFIAEVNFQEVLLVSKLWVKTLDYWETYYDLVALLQAEFQTHQIVISRITLDRIASK
ncbi:MAG: mechanosensitive ion channel [Bacteroidia bacterium]|nr:mechanosensitive ion channel [Bacteroidia bacterium]MDW8158787.1 mechanosensitive ion channel [Bacteroidia bacterium]